MDILESVLNSSSHAIFALDADGIVTFYYNPAFRFPYGKIPFLIGK